jgi:hypothetical protein
MNNKYLVIVAFGVALLAGISFYLNSGFGCADGQGYTIYLSEDNLLNDLNNLQKNHVHSRYLPQTFFTYAAKTETNSCARVINRVIVKEGKEKKVSQDAFNEFITDYNAGCDDCLYRVYQSGNSPVFAKKYSPGESFVIDNNNGTLSLKSLDELVDIA